MTAERRSGGIEKGIATVNATATSTEEDHPHRRFVEDRRSETYEMLETTVHENWTSIALEEFPKMDHPLLGPLFQTRH